MLRSRALLGLLGIVVLSLCFSGGPAWAQTPPPGSTALPEGALVALRNASLRAPTRGHLLAISPDSKILASAHDQKKDSEVILWDTKTGERIGQWALKNCNIAEMAFSPDAKQLAIGMAAAKWAICDLGSPKPSHQDVLPGGAKNQYLTHVAWAPDGQSLYLAGGDKIRQWDLAKRSYRREFAQGADIDVSPDGKYLLAVQPGSPGSAIVYDLAGEKPAAKIEMEGDQSLCRGVAFSPDGAWAAAYLMKRDADGTESIDLCDMSRLEVTKRIKLKRRSLPGNKIHWMSDSKGILIAKGYKTYEVKRVGPGRSPKNLPTWPAMMAMVVSPDGKRFYATGATPQIFAWDFDKAQKTMADLGHTGVLRTAAFFDEDRRILTAADDGTCRIWNAATGEHLTQVQGATVPSGLAKVPAQGSRAAWIGPQAVHFIRLDSAELAGSAKLEGEELTHATADIAGRRFLAAQGNRIHQLDVSAPQKPARSWPVGGRFQLILDASSGIMVAVGNGSYRVYDALAGKQLFAASGETPRLSPYSALSNTGEFFATVMRNQLLAYEVDTGQLLGLYPQMPNRKGNRGMETPIVRSLAISPSGRLLAVGSFRGRVGVYDTNQGKVLAVFAGHSREVTALGFSSDEKKLVSGSIDSSAIVWDLSDLATDDPQARKESFDDLWESLGKSAKAAATAANVVVARGDASVTAIEEKLQPAQRLSAEKIQQLLEQLDSPRFAQRKDAYEELIRHGPAIADAVTRAREQLLEKHRKANTNPPAEKLSRLDKLLEEARRPTTASPEAVRVGRAVRVLERIASPKALSLLGKLARGEQKAHVTVLAQAALRRIEYRRQAANPQ